MPKKKKLRIAMVAPIWLRIPPVKYGGTEWIVYYITEELVRRGHDVTLFAPGNSVTTAKLKSVYPRGLRADKIKWSDQSWPLLHITEAFKQADKFDIMHSHVDKYDLYFSQFIKTPVVSTMHNRLISSDPDNTRLQIYKHYRKHNIIAISHSQRKLALEQNRLNIVDVVYNAIDIENFKYNDKGSDWFIWIARFAKNKGPENAIRAAKLAGIKLKLAGRVDYAAKAYFNEKIKPHIDGKKIKFIGEIKKEQKSNFFGRAKALLNPIEWNEPFGLVMAEAMACGTPVIAYDKGSVPELVKHGVTGYVVKNNIRGLVKAIKNVDQISRKACRERVEQKFSISRMVDGYEKAYYKVIAGHKKR